MTDRIPDRPDEADVPTPPRGTALPGPAEADVPTPARGVPDVRPATDAVPAPGGGDLGTGDRDGTDEADVPPPRGSRAAGAARPGLHRAGRPATPVRTAGPARTAVPPRTAPPVRGADRHARSAVHVLVLAVVQLLALTPLLPVYGPGTLLLPVVGGVVLGAVFGVVAARLRWGAATTTVVLLAVAAVAGGPLAARDHVVARVVPTPASVAEVVRGSALGWKDVLTLQPPVGSSGWLTVPPYLLALASVAVAVRVALGSGRTGPVAALPAVVSLLVAVLLGARDAVLPAVVGTALVLGLVCWAAWRAGRVRVRRPVVLVVLVALAAGSGLGAGTLVAETGDRFVLRDRLVPPFDPQDYASPLSAFRSYVKGEDSTVLFTVQGLPAQARIRLATLDRYDGVVWNVAGDGSTSASGEFRRVGEDIDPEQTTTGTRTQVRVEVQDLSGVWLPTVGQARSITLDDADDRAGLRFNDATGAAVLTGGLHPGTAYTLDTVVPDAPDDAAVAGATPLDLDLPDAESVPDPVLAVAADAIRDATTPGEVALALTQALSEQGYFSHGLTDAGDYPSLSGHGADRLTALLGGDVMVGDDEQYAAAMALMARELGLPARVVMGFVPGDDQEDGEGDGTGSTGSTATDPDAVVDVTGADVRAWVEIAFEGYGWVAFDPTPPQTQTPQEEDETSPSDPEPQVAQPPPPAADPVDPPVDDTEQPQTDDDAQDDAAPLWQRVLVWTGVGLGALLLLLSPLLVVAAAKARRRRRRRRAPDPVDRVVGGWREILDLAVDLRHPPGPVATRREAARTLGAVLDPEADAAGLTGTLTRLALAADRTVFGGRDPDEEGTDRFWADVDHAVSQMRSVVGRRARWRARFTTRSLRNRARTGGHGGRARTRSTRSTP